MSESLINQITLDCLLNKPLYEKFVAKKLSQQIDKKEKKEYRRRIFLLTKELLMSDEERNDILPDVKYAFDNYVKACIHNFKVQDANNPFFSGNENKINVEKISDKEENICEELNDKVVEERNIEECVTEENATEENAETNEVIKKSIKSLHNTRLDHFVRYKKPL